MGLHENCPAYGGRGPSDLRLGVALGIIATIFLVGLCSASNEQIWNNIIDTGARCLVIDQQFFTTIAQIFGVISVLHDLGNHITTVEKADELHNFLLFTWITVFFFNLAIPTGKVAVAAFRIEINSQSNPRIRTSLIAISTLNIFPNIPQVLLIWLQCSPPSALWDPLRQSQCDHGLNVYSTYFVGVVAAISDIYLTVIPITMLLPLRIDRKLKWGLSFLMGCGVFAGAAAIVRTWAAKYVMSEDSSCKPPTLLTTGPGH